MSVPTYPSYRDSGVEWLGEVPSHWDVKRLKRVANVFPSNVDKKAYEGEVAVRLCNYTDVYYNDVIGDDPEFMLATATPDQIEKFTLRAGDTIITKDSETADDIAVAAYVPRDLPGVVCGYHLSMVRPAGGNSGAFLKRFFDSSFAKSSFAVRANGLTRVGLGQYAVDNVDVPLPPPDEQAAIAAFLDRETAKIDALVEEQRRLVELLKEKRQAVISHAVTKGLDPTVPMKDSGVEWLGEVPAHWTVAPLKRFLGILSGYAFPSQGFSSSEDDQRLLRGINVSVGQTRWDDVVFWPRSEGDGLEAFELQGGDIVLGMDRPWIGDGLRVAQLTDDDVPSLLLQRVTALRPTHDLLPRFLLNLLTGEAFHHHCVPEMSGVSVPHISPGQIGDFVVTIPPLQEQTAIVDTVDAMLRRFGELVGAAEAAITLLQERRSALISAAVAGKIDVRGWSAAEVRKTVCAEIVYFNARSRTFGRVKNQKLIYLAEAYAGVHEIGGHYTRHAAGPYDGDLIALVERQLEADGVMNVSQPDGVGAAVSYSITRGWKSDRERLKAMLGDRLAKLDHINTKLADLDTRATEAIATLYAVWNDALLDGEPIDDARLINGFLNDWHPEKRQKFKESDLHDWLGWMRRNGLVPEGRGPKTATGRLFT